VQEKVMKQGFSKKGYCLVSIFGSSRQVHRLVIGAFKGESDLTVDHIDMIKTNNDLVNLRYMTNRANICARHGRPENIYLGVTRVKDQEKWRVEICKGGERMSLGIHNTPELARDKYLETLKYYEENGELPPRRVMKGYTYHKSKKKYVVQFKIKGARAPSKTFNTAEEAQQEYLKIKSHYEKYGTFPPKKVTKGYKFCKKTCKYVAVKFIKRVKHVIGSFDTEQEARNAFLEFKANV